MPKTMSYRSAAMRWQAWRRTTALADADPVNEPFDSAAGDLAEQAEAVILDHEPTDADELALQMEVIIWNIETGGREDGRDVHALKRLRPLLSVMTAPFASKAVA